LLVESALTELEQSVDPGSELPDAKDISDELLAGVGGRLVGRCEDEDQNEV
jgi:hypothetical protein